MGNKQKKPKKKFRETFLYRLLTTLLLLTICAAVGAGYAWSEFKGNPDKFVEKYMKSFISGQWQTMYNMVEVPPNQSLGFKEFKTVMELDPINNIMDYSITQTKKDGANLEYTLDYSIFDEDDPNSETGIEKQMTLRLSRITPWYQPVAQWKIDYDSIIAKDVSIKIPAGITLTFDGYELKPSKEGKSADKYKLGQVFTGTHELLLSQNGTDPVKILKTVEKNNQELDCTKERLVVNGDLQSELEIYNSKVMTLLYQAGMDKSGFDTVKSLFPGEDARNQAQDYFNTEVLGQLYGDYGQEAAVIKSLDFTKMKRSSVTVNQDGTLTAVFKNNYTFAGGVENTSFAGEGVDYSGSYILTVTYGIVLQDHGTWGLDKFTVSVKENTEN